MTNDQLTILLILLLTLAMFLWGRWRHDMVAVGSLVACVLTGLVPPHQAFVGFGHPAVVTVACVLVLSRGLQTSGAVDALTRVLLPARAGVTASLAALCGLGAVLSGFMNNVGAMALLMPVALRLASRARLAPGRVLMPLAFCTILGGMTTLIGTPPNLIVSEFRAQTGAGGFAMFDFTPVGLAVAASGVAFVALLGWRLVPARKQAGVEGFESGTYLTEARVPEQSVAVGKRLSEVEAAIEESGSQVVAMVRRDIHLTAPGPWRRLRAGDILVVEAEAKALASVLSTLGLQLEEAAPSPERDEIATGGGGGGRARIAEGNPGTGNADRAGGDARTRDPEAQAETSEQVDLVELAVLPGSSLVGRSATDILLRTRYGLNLLAVSRHGRRSLSRLRSLTLRPGDLLLMQGPTEVILAFASDNGCVPLAERDLHIPSRRRAWQAGIILALAVSGAAFGLLPASVSFAIGALASTALSTVPARSVYDAIDWSVIVLLGALLPVADAMASTGTAELIARFLLENVAQGNAVIGLTMTLIVSMFLSDLMNNAATAAVMCPIAIATATALGVAADSFLMAVALGASCAFLTPIGHQNNTLILGPGGFGFGDYWRLGAPLEILVAAISIPLLLLVWPL